MRASLLVVRYGADYPNAGYEATNKGKSSPNAPYALYFFSLVFYRFPIPDSRFPIPDSRFPTPYSLIKIKLQTSRMMSTIGTNIAKLLVI
ncbi:MAG: hypothetical protein F6K65_33240 [Moorea sp. SIO3C2]|nr:hypothetical protein [Moorena sp. SIO3C2]